jgi:hypothetical protein
MLTRHQRKRLSEDENQEQSPVCPTPPSIARSFMKFITSKTPGSTKPDESCAHSTKKAKALQESFISSTPLRTPAKSNGAIPSQTPNTKKKKKSVLETIFSPVFKLLSPRGGDSPLFKAFENENPSTPIAVAPVPIAFSAIDSESSSSSTASLPLPPPVPAKPAVEEEAPPINASESEEPPDAEDVEEVSVAHEYARGVDTQEPSFIDMAQFLW